MMLHLGLLGVLLLLAPEGLLGQSRSIASPEAKIVSTSEADQEAAAVFAVNEQDSLALVALYLSTDGANWSNNTNWLTGLVSTWFGVSVVRDRVITLRLERNQLTGSIPAALGNLSELTRLSLHTNALQGSIPAALGNLSQLIFLNLGINELTGSIPAELGNLSQLTSLRLHTNQLEESIPAALSDLSQLITLRLERNQLTGSIPAALGDLSELIRLNLNGNQLTGSVWVELTNLSKLIDLGLQDNQLQGSLPSALGNLSELTTLRLERNQLTGSIPAALGNLSQLIFLNLGINELTGSIPAELGNLSQLTSLRLERNQLTGSIPVELGNLSQLTNLSLNTNQLDGLIPVELGTLSELITLNLQDNQLEGPIPTVLGELSQLMALRLHANQLGGPIPVELGNLSQLANLNLGINQLTGSIPVELGNLSQLTALSLHINQLEGPIPVELGNLSELSTLSLQDNDLVGTIPAVLGNLSQLTALSLHLNQLEGPIPTVLGNLSQLIRLNLNGNQLTGSIPVELDDLSQLTTLNLNANQFEELPLLRGLPELVTLRVQNNRLTFEDIENNIGAADTLEYAPQAKVGTPRQEEIAEGSSLTLSIPVGGERNIYQWFKDGNPITGANTDTHVINSASTADEGEYVLEITNTLATDLTLESEPIQVTVVSVTMSVNINRGFSNALQSTSFLLVGLPGNIDVSLSSTVTGQPGEFNDWRAFRDNGTEGTQDVYLEEHNGSSTFNFRPGRGFWLLSNGRWTFVDPEVPIVMLSANGTYAISVHNGFNIISNPFDQNVSWASVLAVNGLSLTTSLYRWGGSFSTTNTFTSASTDGEAFYFNNETGLTELEIPYPGQASIPEVPPLLEPTQVLTLSVYREGRLASSVHVGVAEQAEAGRDEYDQIAPPGYFEAASLRLVHGSSTEPRSEWASEYRPEDESGYVFDLVLSAPEQTPVTLQVEELEAFAGREIYLIDRRLDKAYDLRAHEALPLTASPEPSRYQLMIGTQTFVDEAGEEQIPEKIALLGNYPNPFNPRTVIEYAIPVSAAGEVVRLEVYDVMGRRVHVLVDVRQKAGYYRVAWDGVDQAGTPVASGVYLYRLHVGAFHQIRKMILMK